MARKKKGPAVFYRFQCKSCALKFRAKLYDGDPDPDCPNCSVTQTPIGMDVGGGKAPLVGGNVMVRAMDATAKAVMEDHGMTDLRSARQGESMAPKLPPAQQAQADAMFNPARRGEMFGGGNMLGQAFAGVAASAMAGANFSAANTQGGGIDPIATIHQKRYKPPIRVVANFDG